MARCAPVTDASGGPTADDPDDRPDGHPDEDDADLGWRALAGSLDDFGFAPPAPAEPSPTESHATDPDASGSDTADEAATTAATADTAAANKAAVSNATTDADAIAATTVADATAAATTDADATAADATTDADATDATTDADAIAAAATTDADATTAAATTVADATADATTDADAIAAAATTDADATATAATSATASTTADPSFAPPTSATAEHPDTEFTASGHPRSRQFSRGSIGLIITLLVLTILFGSGFRYKLYDKAVIAPGTTADIEDFVDVANNPAYASDASISLVSVRTSFAPSLFEVIGGWLDGALEVVDLEAILGERTVAENREAGRLQMDQSTQIAVAVALEHLGYDIMSPIGARVERVVPGAPAHEALRIGDIVQRVDDTAIETAQQLSDTIKANEPGTEATLTALDPDGQIRDVTVTLAERGGVTLLGVIVTTHVEFEEPPIDVTLNIENIGGPSAGLAFTLSVIDALTPEPLTGNLDIAATGTIHHDGTIGPIGGVPQKSHAVVRAGTDLFLVPASQLEEAIAVAESSVAVVGVETLADALAAIEAHQS